MAAQEDPELSSSTDPPRPAASRGTVPSENDPRAALPQRGVKGPLTAGRRRRAWVSSETPHVAWPPNTGRPCTNLWLFPKRREGLVPHARHPGPRDLRAETSPEDTCLGFRAGDLRGCGEQRLPHPGPAHEQLSEERLVHT